MLSRAGSDASTRLHRSKSTASVKQRRSQSLMQEPVDRESARIYAITAANIAMGRASDRASAESRRSAELARYDSHNSRPGSCAKTRSQNLRFSPATELRRQRSVLPKPPLQPLPPLEADQSRYTQLSQYTEPTPSEFGVREGHGFEPSSYRRIRKSRSSLTPIKRAMSLNQLAPHTPSPAHTLRTVQSTLGDTGHGLRYGLKRSMSFLRASSSNMSRAFHRTTSEVRVHDQAVQMAQAQFYNDIHQQNDHRAPSTLFTPKLRLNSKASRTFRKTVRSSRTTEFGDGVKSENQANTEIRESSRPRALSASFRNKMRSVFSKSSTAKYQIPAQQLDANRPYFRDYVDGSGEACMDQYFAGQVDNARGSVYIPSNQTDPLEDLDKLSANLRSSQSMDSLHSNGRSRVTSWTNSTMTGSLATRGTPLERKRLSIIKEDGGPHQPSSSIGRHVGGIEVFRKPLPAYNAHGQPLDSQRIYSALMKRIDQEQADAEGVEDLNTPIHEQDDLLPSSAPMPTFKPTIRAVPSEASLRTLAPDKEHRQFSIGEHPWQMNSETDVPAQHNERLDERTKAKLAQQDAQSSFFPFSAQGKPVTPSPFKMALAARKEQTSESESESVVVTRQLPPGNPVQSRNIMSTDSVYSRTTGGHMNSQYHLDQDSPDDADDERPTGGRATIIPSRVSRYPRPTPSLLQMHRTRSSERGDWRGWMENQMTTLDRCNSRASQFTHHREHAQINGDDTDIGSGPQSLHDKWQRRPSTRSQRSGNAGQQTPAQRPTSSMMNDRFPLLDLKDGPKKSTPRPVAVAERASMIGMKDENRRASSGGSHTQRKISDRFRSAVGLKPKDETSSPNTESSNTRTEKRPPARTPISTPGRLYILGRKENRLKPFAPSDETTPTPKRPESRYGPGGWGDFGRDITNSSGNMNMSRLSRPFDMDIPDANRPFDLEFLGNETTHGQFTGKAGRLSVAPAATHGAPTYVGETSPGSDTALPKIRDEGDRVANSSKRMVSNFLRSRRRGASGKNASEEAGSPAFV